jgi:hypothetical protein
MKMGVRISPWSVEITPARAADPGSRAVSWNENIKFPLIGQSYGFFRIFV